MNQEQKHLARLDGYLKGMETLIDTIVHVINEQQPEFQSRLVEKLLKASPEPIKGSEAIESDFGIASKNLILDFIERLERHKLS